jgi:MFS family permease
LGQEAWVTESAAVDSTSWRAPARRITATLFLAQSLGSAALITAATVTSIVAADLGGTAAWAGIPTAALQVAAALSAFGWGYLMDWLGRRGGLGLGMVLGVGGSLLAGGAVVWRSFPLFLAGMAVTGASRAALQLGRFAAAEVHPPDGRGRAISNVVLGGTVGAIFGPLLVAPSGAWTQAAGLPELVGPYAVGLLLFVAAGLAIGFWLRPDPRDLGRALAQVFPDAGPAGAARPLGEILRQPAVVTAMVAMAVGQMVMIMLMVITSLHMSDHQHNLGAISVVVSSHTLGMYAFSLVSGRLADRWGRGPVILIGAATLLLACLLAPLSPRLVPLAVALFLLGLGWNFCYVGGSSLLADQLAPAERARVQGFNDLVIGMASAAGSLGSGVVFAALGFGAMGLVGAAASLLPLALTAWWRRGQPRPAQS